MNSMRRVLAVVGLCSLFACPPVKVTPAAVLLPGVGTSTKLVVRAFDVDGNVIPTPSLVFTSNNALVSAAADGTLAADLITSNRVLTLTFTP